jgi:hypothetical protein
MLRIGRIAVFLLGTIVVAVAGCTPETPQAPDVPLRRGVRTVFAVGDGLTAGLMNGGLRDRGQLAGFANLISRQVSGGSVAMQHPLVSAPGIGIDPMQFGTGTLRVLPSGAIGRDPIPGFDPGNPLPAIVALLKNASYPVPYGNLGVPGALAGTMTTVTASGGNSQLLFYDAILRNAQLPPGDATQMDQVEHLVAKVSANPRLLLLWVGSTDLYFRPGAALGGGAAVTPSAEFETAFGAIASRVAVVGVDMVAVGNLPSVTSMPYFTTVPPVGPISGEPFNTDESDVELILLPAQPLVFLPSGLENPDYLPGGSSSLPGSLTLTTDELDALEAAVDAYNVVIADAAAAHGWALADIHTAWASLPDDPTDPAHLLALNAIYPWGPYEVDGELAQNFWAAFSLDGVTPSERGYGRVTNLFLDAIDATYEGANYPRVDHSDIKNNNGFEDAPTGAKVPFGGLFDSSAWSAVP